MDRVLQEFDETFADSGDTYFVYLYGRPRSEGLWEGWLVFERESDGRRFATPAETTQPDAEAVLFWSTGLSDVYLEGALRRAFGMHARESKPPAPMLVGSGEETSERIARLSQVELGVLWTFQRLRAERVLTQQVFDELPYAPAEVHRAIQDLETRHRLIVRRTMDGSDWLQLTDDGAAETRIREGSEARPRFL